MFDIDYSDEPKAIDRPGSYPPEEAVAAAAALERANRWLGGRRALLRHAMPMIREAARRDPKRPVLILDLGAGCGAMTRELAAACRRSKLRFAIEAVEVNRDLANAGREFSERAGFSEIRHAVADPFRLVADHQRESFDVAVASLFLQRHEPEERVALLEIMARLARRGIVAADVVRNPASLAAWKAIGALNAHPAFRADAIATARRALTLEEWAEVAKRSRLPGIALWPSGPCRVALVWERLVETVRVADAEDGSEEFDPLAAGAATP